MPTFDVNAMLALLRQLTGNQGPGSLSRTEFTGPEVEYQGTRFRLTPAQAFYYQRALEGRDRGPLIPGDQTENPIGFAQLYRHRRNEGMSHEQAVQVTNAAMAPGQLDRKGRPLFNALEQILAGYAPGGFNAAPGVENSLGGGTGGGGTAGGNITGVPGPGPSPGTPPPGAEPPGLIGPPEQQANAPTFNFTPPAPISQQGSPVQGAAFGQLGNLPTAGPISQGLNTNPLQRGGPGTMALPNLLKRLTPFR